MPKLKTKQILVKRFRITKNGKVLRRRAFGRHLKVKKSAKRRARLSKIVEMKGPLAKKIKKVMGK